MFYKFSFEYFVFLQCNFVGSHDSHMPHIFSCTDLLGSTQRARLCHDIMFSIRVVMVVS